MQPPQLELETRHQGEVSECTSCADLEAVGGSLVNEANEPMELVAAKPESHFPADCACRQPSDLSQADKLPQGEQQTVEESARESVPPTGLPCELLESLPVQATSEEYAICPEQRAHAMLSDDLAAGNGTAPFKRTGSATFTASSTTAKSTQGEASKPAASTGGAHCTFASGPQAEVSLSQANSLGVATQALPKPAAMSPVILARRPASFTLAPADPARVGIACQLPSNTGHAAAMSLPASIAPAAHVETGVRRFVSSTQIGPIHLSRGGAASTGATQAPPWLLSPVPSARLVAEAPHRVGTWVAPAGGTVTGPSVPTTRSPPFLAVNLPRTAARGLPMQPALVGAQPTYLTSPAQAPRRAVANPVAYLPLVGMASAKAAPPSGATPWLRLCD